MANSKGHSTFKIETEALETIKKGTNTVSKKASKAAVSELMKGVSTAWDQLLGVGSYAKKSSEKHASAPEAQAQEATPGLIFSSSNIKEQKLHRKYQFDRRGEEKTEQKQVQETRRKPEAQAAIDYHEQFTLRSKERKLSREQSSEMNSRVQEIMIELKKLVKSSQELQTQFVGVAMEQGPVEVGTYHLTFFEWMLIVIRQAKQKVDDAGAWLGTMKGKKGKKDSGYWGMFKKHGTSFGMSNERSVATQVG